MHKLLSPTGISDRCDENHRRCRISDQLAQLNLSINHRRAIPAKRKAVFHTRHIQERNCSTCCEVTDLTPGMHQPLSIQPRRASADRCDENHRRSRISDPLEKLNLSINNRRAITAKRKAIYHTRHIQERNCSTCSDVTDLTAGMHKPCYCSRDGHLQTDEMRITVGVG